MCEIVTYDRQYFESDDQTRGYRNEGFRDFPAHFAAIERILKMKPTNVLEIGGARGYVAKKLICYGVPTTVMEISDHCYHTRAVDSFVRHDIEKSPYPFKDKQFDLLFSDSVMEHLHYEHIDDVIKEITRVSKRSLHGVPITESGQTHAQFKSDDTHVIYESKDWWINKFASIDPTHNVEISGNILGDAKNMIIIPRLSIDGTDLVKLNVGSFINMFFYGWTNIDTIDLAEFAESEQYIFRQHDVTKPFVSVGDDTVDLIFTSHMLEHLSQSESINFLKECHRMMRSGGLIRIAVPNIGLLMRKYMSHDLDFLKHISPSAESSECMIDKFHAVALANHAQLFDSCNLSALMEHTGFKNISLSDPFHSRSEIMEKETIVSHPSISLVMEGVK